MKVLVVDDSSMMRRIVSQCLDEIGGEDLKVIEAANGMHALTAISDDEVEHREPDRHDDEQSDGQIRVEIDGKQGQRTAPARDG